MSNKKSNPMWGGRFTVGFDEVMEKINASIDFDKRLYNQDINGSIGHCKMLVLKKILDEADGRKIIEGLQQVRKEIESGQFNFRHDLEDIHMNVEARLFECIGEPAKRLHTARSRNDQVTTDLRLWIREAIDNLRDELKLLQSALINKAEEQYDTVMPGFTHMQTAQPVTLGHHLMAYVEMLTRDDERLEDCRKRVNTSPLGAAALAGTPYPTDPFLTASELAFDRVFRNSLDAVSDRDYVIEFLFACSLCAIHLSRLCEELVIWCSSQYKFIVLPDSFTTGSSIMPQKKNPDAAELIRAKSGRVTGNLIAMMMIMKAIPLSYNKDMQEDKETSFDSYDTLLISLKALSIMISEMTVNRQAMRNAAEAGFSVATDLADWLVTKLNIPFRKAHHITGSLVKIAEDKNIMLNQLTLEEMKSIEPSITEEVFNVLNVDFSVKSRKSFGGTAPDNVLFAIAEARKRVEIKQSNQVVAK